MLNRSSSSRCPILEFVEAAATVGDELQAKQEAVAAVVATKARRPNSGNGSSSDNAWHGCKVNAAPAVAYNNKVIWCIHMIADLWFFMPWRSRSYLHMLEGLIDHSHQPPRDWLTDWLTDLLSHRCHLNKYIHRSQTTVLVVLVQRPIPRTGFMPSCHKRGAVPIFSIQFT